MRARCVDESVDGDGVRRAIERWYLKVRRDLPWRRGRDAYAIWVSETMLQQTRVETVLPYFERFMRELPGVRALAETPLSRVLTLWSGLGYYRRAHMMHAAARTMVDEFDGRVPKDPRELMRLPGIGRYTAGAIASLAYGERVPIVDGNVRRVLARIFAIESNVSSGRGSAEIWKLAADLVTPPGLDPGILNQGLMELGATVCLPRDPDCSRCPVRALCAGHAKGWARRLPITAPKRAPIATRLTGSGCLVRCSRHPRTTEPGGALRRALGAAEHRGRHSGIGESARRVDEQASKHGRHRARPVASQVARRSRPLPIGKASGDRDHRARLRRRGNDAVDGGARAAPVRFDAQSPELGHGRAYEPTLRRKVTSLPGANPGHTLSAAPPPFQGDGEAVHVLVVDDEPALRRSLARVLEARGIRVGLAEDGRQAIEYIQRTPPDVALVDMMMPGLGGLEVLAHVKSADLALEVILMTAFADVDSAVEAMKAGAYHFLTKPFHSNDAVAHAVLKAAEHRRLADRARRLEQVLLSKERFGELIGDSPRMLDVYRLIEGVSPTSSTVLILGESGTGKELVARAIHQQSPRSKKPFVAVNCGAIPRELVESELFGHLRGAFTGAQSARTGLFETADGGTILLDEVGDLPLAAQVKLLRALQDGEIKRVGADESRTVDVRVLAATNVDFSIAFDRGSFDRTSTIASTSSPSSFRPCESAAMTSCSSRITTCRSSLEAWDATRSISPPTPFTR